MAVGDPVLWMGGSLGSEAPADQPTFFLSLFSVLAGLEPPPVRCWLSGGVPEAHPQHFSASSHVLRGQG